MTQLSNSLIALLPKKKCTNTHIKHHDPRICKYCFYDKAIQDITEILSKVELDFEQLHQILMDNADEDSAIWFGDTAKAIASQARVK